MPTIFGHHFGRNLWKAGIIPNETGDIELKIPVDGIMQLHYVVNVTQEMLPFIAEAMLHSHEDQYEPTKRFRLNNAAEFGPRGERLPVLRARNDGGGLEPISRDELGSYLACESGIHKP